MHARRKSEYLHYRLGLWHRLRLRLEGPRVPLALRDHPDRLRGELPDPRGAMHYGL